MKTIDLDMDGEALTIRIIDQVRGQIAKHTLRAVGPSGSLAYFQGGPCFDDQGPPPLPIDDEEPLAPSPATPANPDPASRSTSRARQP